MTFLCFFEDESECLSGEWTLTPRESYDERLGDVFTLGENILKYTYKSAAGDAY